MRFLLVLRLGLLAVVCAAGLLSAQDGKPVSQVVYRNAQYDFCVLLPASWRGYTILTDKWEGYSSAKIGTFVEGGPRLRIRNPAWTEADPHEDIPIMIFTLAQWKRGQKEDLIFSPAPIGPGELTRNGRYVFALPARYNYDLATGYQEVDALIANKAIKAPCPQK
jgi:hypothetical protein